jgi:hypothetical protein
MHLLKGQHALEKRIEELVVENKKLKAEIHRLTTGDSANE